MPISKRQRYTSRDILQFVSRPRNGRNAVIPFGAHVRVYNLDNGRNVVVTIVDRGLYATTGRIIDLSTVAADVLGMRQAGVANVRLELVQ